MKIIIKKGRPYVLRHRRGQCYAAVFPADLNDRQIRSRILQGEAAFFPFSKRKWEFQWERGSGRPLHFKR